MAPAPSAVDDRSGPRPADPRPGRSRRTDRAAQEPGAVPGASFREVPVDAIRPNAKQPRQVFDEDALEELETSIREFGLLQPVVVRETGPVRTSW